MPRRYFSIILVVVIVLIGLIAFVFNAEITESDQVQMTVFVASSLTDVFLDVREQFEARYPNIEINYSFGGSSTLSTQIREGAPADIFASANIQQMSIIEADGLLSDPSTFFAYNQLVIIVPSDNPANIASLDDLKRSNLRIITATEGVPIRTYIAVLLDQLAESSIFGSQFREAFLANIVSEELNVRDVVAKIALGEGDVAIVYQSDVTSDMADELMTISLPTEFNPIVAYSIGILADGANQSIAQTFINFLASEEGQETFIRWGFLPVNQAD